MQIDQLFEFVYVLIDKKQVTAKEMATRFGVSTRTIYRWVEALSVSGVPIYSVKGHNGGIAISESYTLDKTVLSDEEKLAIVSSVKALNSLSGTSANEINAKAAQKISNLVSSDTDWIEVDFAPWSPEGSEVRQIFENLRQSILNKRQIKFDYYSGNGKTESRTVHPWKLIYKGQAWYLQGWCTVRKAERFFKLTRMRNLIIIGKIADITKQAASKTALQNNTHAQDMQPLPTIEIKATISASKVSYLMDTFICSEVSTHKDGSISAVFTVPLADWIYNLLLSFGSDMKIISPKDIQEKVISMAEDVVKNYSS